MSPINNKKPESIFTKEEYNDCMKSFSKKLSNLSSNPVLDQFVNSQLSVPQNLGSISSIERTNQMQEKTSGLWSHKDSAKRMWDQQNPSLELSEFKMTESKIVSEDAEAKAEEAYQQLNLQKLEQKSLLINNLPQEIFIPSALNNSKF